MSESIALLVGATELMPGNASRVARGLRTITLGLQGLDDEGEESFELVSKLQDQFDKLSISLVDGNGQLRSSYDILYDLNGIWGSLDKNTRVYISELVAGRRFLLVRDELTGTMGLTTHILALC